MKTTMKIAVIAMMGLGLNSLGQEFKEDVKIKGDSNQKHYSLSFYRNDNAKFMTIGQSKPNDYNSTFDFHHHNGNPFRFLINNKEILRFLSNGNVGIGTSNPLAGLEVKNDDGIKIQSLQNGGWRGSIKMTDGFSNVTSRDDMLFSTPGGFMFKMDDNKNGISTIQGFNIYDRNNKSVFTIRESNGNAALHGKFEAEEIKVTTSPTADFVFEEDYNLPTLKSIEKHIKEKKHLPEIASAKEMEKNGVNVGEFQIQLLQKIEELTLYTIEQEKKLKSQEDKINVLENQNVREGIKIFSNWPTIPQLYIKVEFIGGADIIKEMYESGELAKLT